MPLAPILNLVNEPVRNNADVIKITPAAKTSSIATSLKSKIFMLCRIFRYVTEI